MQILFLALALIAAMAIHEAGHYIAARLLGYRLKFRFEWGRFYVPRFIWTMPTEHRTEQRVIAAVGFELELAAIIPALFCGLWQYNAAALAHLIAYQFYAGDSNDFHYL